MLSQREGVYQVVCKYIEVANNSCEIGDMKPTIVSELCEMFINEEITMSEKAREKYSNPKDLRGYVGGLVNNWLRKDTRLNGGDKYVTKNPGSRAGSSDSIVKNLKALRSTMTDEVKIKEIDSAIEARQAEIKVKKVVEVDLSTIDPELLKKLGINPED